MADKPVVSFFVTSASLTTPKRTNRNMDAAAHRFKRLSTEPQDLWPSRRGTEIAHMAARFDAVEGALRRITAAKDGAVYEYPDRDLRAILLKGLAGQHVVTIVEERSVAPGLLSVVADAKADPAPILDVLRHLLAGTAHLQPSAPDQPFTA
ncbi:MAG: hypothetical protein CFE34_06940 [Rhodobacteraceae bacterium PARR1]|nr:MAG: hypothetical protein CFE34_06940 [Rhodobacteraceae bacterium PARR1]